MAIKPQIKSSSPTSNYDLDPQSHLRMKQVPERDVSVDDQLEALWRRVEAKEITLDEATEEMKKISLADARKNLGDADYSELSEYMKTMAVE